MDRRISASVIISLFMLASFAIANPVQAHFTLGDLTGTYRFHQNDFDPHVFGVIGYVWPGGGQNAYAGIPNVVNSFNAPGYQSPYPCRANGEPVGSGGTAGGSSPGSVQPCRGSYQFLVSVAGQRLLSLRRDPDGVDW